MRGAVYRELQGLKPTFAQSLSVAAEAATHKGSSRDISTFEGDDGLRGDGLPAANSVHSFIGLGFQIDGGSGDPE
jgi:hypothetical protein